MNPLFSIVVPTLNEEQYLPNLLTSLSQQTEKNFEVIIADGNSQDATRTIAEKFQSRLPFLQVITTRDRGVSKQRNAGSAIARGEWIITTDADTIFKPYCLSQIKFWIHEKKHKHFTSWFSSETDNPNDALLILFINAGMEISLKMKRPAAYGAFMVTHADLFRKLNGFDESLEFGEDNDLCRRAYEATGELMGMIREGLVTYSLRRFHHHGLIHTLQLYARASFVLLLTKRTPAKLPGYVMGGHVYTEKEKKAWTTLLKDYEKTIRKFINGFGK
ncbi:MAG: glycosyltransferase [Patescibacteria group bacterium]|nr:glycosyltransferase [Patescibacteria group bacterium]